MPHDHNEKETVAWLIEFTGYHGALWWNGSIFSRHPHIALRFETKADAEEYMRKFIRLNEDVKATEHFFYDGDGQ